MADRDQTTTPHAALSAMASSHPDLGLSLIENSQDCVKLIETDGTIGYINTAGTTLMEIDDMARVKGTRWLDLWPGQTNSDLERAMAEALSGKSSRFAGLCPTSKGTIKWLDVVINPIFGQNRSVERLLCVCRDISELKHFEERLRFSEHQFHALADNMAQLAWLADATGYIFWYNQRWFEYTGTTLEQMKGWGWRSVHHPDHVDRVVWKITEHFETELAWEDVFPLRRADGVYRWFLSRAMPIRNEQGKVFLWCGTNTDITEQRNASAWLRQKARLVEQSHEAILVWELEGGIVSWNRGCEELYGYTRREALGAASHDLLRTKHPAGLEAFATSLRSEGSWSGELQHLAKDGRPVWVDSRQELIRTDGRDLVLETNRDISERRKADHVRTLLVGELNHRVKNSLAIVQSIANQTARNSRDIKQFLASFNARLQALSSAHDQLTDMNWIGADLRKIIQEQWSHSGQNGTANITLEGPSVFLPAQTALQISLIIFELISNARQHGALSVATGQVTITWGFGAGSPAKLHLKWQEEGGPPVQQPTRRGFGMTLVERVGNQPYLQARMTFPATGAVCDMTVELPETNTGAPTYFDPRFRDLLPPLKPASPLPVTPRPTTDTAGLRVFIIEDEPLIAMTIEDIIHDAGMLALTPVASIEAALGAIRTTHFDVAIVDGNLLGQPVDMVVAELRKRKIPFVFVTGFNRRNLPVVEPDVPVVMKPIDPGVLVRAVRTVVTG